LALLRRSDVLAIEARTTETAQQHDNRGASSASQGTTMSENAKLPPPPQRLREGQAGPNVAPPALRRVRAVTAVPPLAGSLPAERTGS